MQERSQDLCRNYWLLATCDAYHVTTPDGESKALTQCMNLAIGQAEVDKNSVNYVNAHGTSTPYNDKSETTALKMYLAIMPRMD